VRGCCCDDRVYQEHIDEECTWDTDASLYMEQHAEPHHEEQKIDSPPPRKDRSGMMVQDVLLPGYRKEWESSRKVRSCRGPVVVLPLPLPPPPAHPPTHTTRSLS
jgi:hypothetical protein